MWVEVTYRQLYLQSSFDDCWYTAAILSCNKLNLTSIATTAHTPSPIATRRHGRLAPLIPAAALSERARAALGAVPVVVVVRSGQRPPTIEPPRGEAQPLTRGLTHRGTDLLARGCRWYRRRRRPPRCSRRRRQPPRCFRGRIRTRKFPGQTEPACGANLVARPAPSARIPA